MSKTRSLPYFSIQPGRYREDTTRGRDILPEEDHPIVARHLLVQSIANRLPEVDLSHRVTRSFAPMLVLRVTDACHVPRSPVRRCLLRGRIATARTGAALAPR